MSVEPYDSQSQGAIMVTSASPRPVHWFQVLQDGSALPGNPPLLGSSVEVLPGTYVVRLNGTEREVTIEAGRRTIVRSGDLLVEGDGAMWWPVQGGDRKVASNPPILGSFVALFAGDYQVIVYEGVGSTEDTIGVAQVLPGRVTTVTR
jgi:hypothetical protein